MTKETEALKPEVPEVPEAVEAKTPSLGELLAASKAIEENQRKRSKEGVK